MLPGRTQRLRVKINAKNCHFIIFWNFLWRRLVQTSFFLQLQIDAEQAEKDSLEAERHRIEERLQVHSYNIVLSGNSYRQ